MSQIKNYYYDHKKQFGKSRGAGDKSGDSDGGKGMRTSAPGSTDGESDFAERTEMFFAPGGVGQYQEVGMQGSMETDLSEQQRAALHAQSLQSAAEIWARAQIQQQQEQHFQHQQEQQLQQQLSSHEARRLLHSHQHQQVMSNLSSMFPWVTAAQVAQVQAAALQQQQQAQQEQQQDGNGLAAAGHSAGWADRKFYIFGHDDRLLDDNLSFLLFLLLQHLLKCRIC